MRCTPSVAGLSTAMLIAAGFAMPAQAAEEPTPPALDVRPNVVMVLTDDVGFDDLMTRGFGPNGSGADTPWLNQMANEGAILEQAYSTPSCSPTRMAMLSGLAPTDPDNYSFQVGPLYGDNAEARDRILRGIPQGPNSDDQIALKNDTVTVGEMAQSVGYETQYVGKFHATATEGAITSQHGFEFNYGGKTSGAAEDYLARNGVFDVSVGAGLNGPPGADGKGIWAAPYTQAYVDENVAPYSQGLPAGALTGLVGKNKNVNDAIADAMESEVGVGLDPTFTFVGQYTVHDPITIDNSRWDLRQKYSAKFPNNSDFAGYASLIDNMDQTMGRLMDYLRTTDDPRNPGNPLSENTIVMFTNDNGGRTQLGADNSPYRGQKFETFEGGVRVPFMAWSDNPALVTPGNTNDSVVNSMDFMPTLAELIGATVPADADGRSYASALKSPTLLPQSHMNHLPGYYINGGRNGLPTTTLRRQNNWKLTYRYENRTFFLSNLSTDPGESAANLASSRRSVTDPMIEEMLTRLNADDPGLPVLREGKPNVVLDMTRGTKYYRYGNVQTVDSRFDLVVRPGTEMPVLFKPDLSNS